MKHWHWIRVLICGSFYRVKSKFPAVEEAEEYVEVIDVGARQIPPTHSASLQSMPQTSISATQISTSLTKSLRTIRRRRLSDFHFEPLHKRRKISKNIEITCNYYYYYYYYYTICMSPVTGISSWYFS